MPNLFKLQRNARRSFYVFRCQTTALLAFALMALPLTTQVKAASFTIVNGQTVTGPLSLLPGETGLVEGGGLLTSSVNTLVLAGGGASTIINNGTINSTINRAIDAASGSGSTIINNGTITSGGSTQTVLLDSLQSNFYFENNGSVSSIGANSEALYLRADSSIVINTGLISNTGIGSNGSAFEVEGDNNVVTNSGTITATTSVGFKFHPTLASGNVFNNSGIISAPRAILGGTGLSTINLMAGSRITGTMDLGGGTDIVNLYHGGNDIAWRWTFENFKDTTPDVLSVIGAPYVVEDPGLSGGTGITVTVADLSREANAGAVLADLTGAVRGAITGRISEAWALSDAGLSSGGDMTDEDGNSLGWNAWTKAFEGRSADAHHIYGGVVVGADTAPTDNTLFGAFGGFALSKLTFADASLNNSGIADVYTNSGFGGIYSRIQNTHGLFVDGTVTLGYAEGDVAARWQANNLVAGGLEQITGGESAGAYVATSVTFGAHMPVGDSSVVITPSATFGYAAQFRKGYSENASVEGAMSVKSYIASVLTTRLQLAAQKSGSNTNGMGWTAVLRGGIDVEKDVSQDVKLTMVGTTLSADVAPDAAELAGFLGTNLALALSQTIAFNLDGEMTFASNNADGIGGILSTGIRVQF